MRIYSVDRRTPIKLFDDFGVLDGLTPCDKFSFSALKDEYFVVQLALTECEGNISVSDFENIESRIMFYNLEGTDKHGEHFTREYEAKKAVINPFFIGVDLTGLDSGSFGFSFTLNVGSDKEKINISLDISAQESDEHGYNDITSLARLNWLNSKTGLDHTLPKPFTPIELDGDTVKILGRSIILDEGLQLSQTYGYFDESLQLKEKEQTRLLSEKSAFSIGEEIKFGKQSVKNDGDCAELTVNGESDSFNIDTSLTLRCEGTLDYIIKLTAKKDASADVALTVPFDNYASQYCFGLGEIGGRSKSIDFKWNDDRQDCLFVGNVNIGARVKLMAENYRNPLVNIYYHSLPLIKPVTTWDNNGAGSIHFNNGIFKAATESIRFNKGESRVFRFEYSLTPFKPVDWKSHYRNRYYQSYYVAGEEYSHLDTALRGNTNIFNIHHGNELHPYINYPFIEVERLKKFVKKAHDEGVKVKLYYTAREMSNHTAEMWFYKSLGNEIILQKSGDGMNLPGFTDDWLNEYFGGNIIKAWQVHYTSGAHKGDDDIAFIVTPDSRLENYFVEGLEWLVKHIGIDGIYIDDTSLDAVTMRRVKKILDPVGGLIDMHMWNHECDCAGNEACSNIYMDIFPYMDSLWIGENFDVKLLTEEQIFTEVSGLFFGNTSEMLENGGDLYCGMLYGMSNRYGWRNWDAVRTHRVWDDFGIEDAQIFGYWHSACPIKSDNNDVKITVYKKADSVLVCVYNFSSDEKKFTMSVDASLRLNPESAKYYRLYPDDTVNNTNKVAFNGISRLSGRKGLLLCCKTN